MQNKIFTAAAFLISLVFWFFDASMHYFVYNEAQFEFIPHDFDELWMRLVIVILILLLGIFADYFSNKITTKQKQLEAARIYNSMSSAGRHILNNLLNEMQLFKMEALKCKNFDADVLKMYDTSINEASDLIKRLSQVEDITEDNIWASINPQSTKQSPDSETSETHVNK